MYNLFANRYLRISWSVNREFKLHVLTANGKRQSVSDSASFFSNQ